MKKIILVLSIIFLTACSGIAHLPEYQAQGVNQFNGEAQLGEFSYLPAEQGLVKSNQIQNTAVGSLYFENDVAEIVKKATAVELKNAGFTLGTGNHKILGKVKEFKMDDLGYSADLTYIINYKITDLNNSKTLLDRDYVANKKSLSKLTTTYQTMINSLNSMIFSGYDKFITDPEVRRILEKK